MHVKLHVNVIVNEYKNVNSIKIHAPNIHKKHRNMSGVSSLMLLLLCK